MYERKEYSVEELLAQLDEWDEESFENEKREAEPTKNTKSVLVRFDNEEYEKFRRILKASGLKQMTFARSRLLEEPIYGRVQRDLIAINTIEIIRAKNKVADLTQLIVALLKQKNLSQEAEKLLAEEVEKLEKTRVELHRKVGRRWRF